MVMESFGHMDCDQNHDFEIAEIFEGEYGKMVVSNGTGIEDKKTRVQIPTTLQLTVRWPWTSDLMPVHLIFLISMWR